MSTARGISTSPSLPDLCHHRWIIPALAGLHALEGATRFVVLNNRLRSSRESLRTALTALLEWQLIERNPGYGHPLRPEYRLTGRGQPIARACADYAAAADRVQVNGTAFRKWTAPMLVALGQGHHRFSDIQQALPGITPRALTTSLKNLTAAGLVCRTVEPGYPPRADYRLSQAAQPLAEAAGRLAHLLQGEPRDSVSGPDLR